MAGYALVGLVLCALLSAFVAIESRADLAVRWCVAALVALALLATLRCGRGRQRSSSRAWVIESMRAAMRWRAYKTGAVVGTAIWTFLIVAIASFDELSFARRRHDFPTLTYYFGELTRQGWSRGILFGAWLAWGLWIVFGWRGPGQSDEDSATRTTT